MTTQLIDRIRGLDGVTFHRPLANGNTLRSDNHHTDLLPQAHRDVLEVTNGLEVYGGCFRLFGIGTAQGIDALQWNREEYWKFAWGGRCSPYWCFAETAWGDQYGYLIDDAGAGRVYFLDALSMTAEPLAESFVEFFERELVRCAARPYDEMMVAARRKFGEITPMSHLVYVPSLLLGGSESIETVEIMDARCAMICNGDIARQLDVTEAPSGTVSGVEAYEDEFGRPRLRLTWS